MGWSLKYAKDEKQLRLLAEKGRPGPMRVMSSRPRLMIHLEYVWTGFQRLTSCRPLGPAGVGHIPWTAIDRYCCRYDIEDEEYEYFVSLIESLDEIYLEHQPKPDKPGSNRRGAGK